MYLAEGPVLMLIENGTQWRSWGTLHPPAPSERIIPTRNGTVPPPQGRGGTWYASTGNVRHVRCGGNGSSAPKHLGVPSRSLEGHRGRWQGTPQRYAPTNSRASLSYSPYAVRRGPLSSLARARETSTRLSLAGVERKTLCGAAERLHLPGASFLGAAS